MLTRHDKHVRLFDSSVCWNDLHRETYLKSLNFGPKQMYNRLSSDCPSLISLCLSLYNKLSTQAVWQHICYLCCRHLVNKFRYIILNFECLFACVWDRIDCQMCWSVCTGSLCFFLSVCQEHQSAICPHPAPILSPQQWNTWNTQTQNTHTHILSLALCLCLSHTRSQKHTCWGKTAPSVPTPCQIVIVF